MFCSDHLFLASACVYVTLFPVAHFISSFFITSMVRFELRIYETLVSNFLFGARVAKDKKKRKNHSTRELSKSFVCPSAD